MKKIISLVLVTALIICSLPSLVFSKEVLMVQRADGFERYEVGKTFNSKSGTFRAFGNYSNSPVITEDVAYEGKKSLCMSGVSHTSASLKILNFLQRKITSADVGTTFNISFMIYPDKTKGVYSSKGNTPDDCTPFTEEQLKETVSTEFRLMLAGPDGQNYKYRQGYNTKGEYLEFNPKWNQWNKVEFSYTVTEDFLDDGSIDNLSNPYIDSLRLYQNGVDFSINQGIANTYYVDNFSVTALQTINSTTVETTRVDDLEDYETGKTLTSSSGTYRAFGGHSNAPKITEANAYDGKKSILMSDICYTSASLKVLNFLQRDITTDDVGKTFRISFMMYPIKSEGVYSSLGETTDECTPFTQEELDESVGTRYNVVLTGPDGQNYKYRQSSTDDNHSYEVFLPWDEWTEVAIYYTVDDLYLDNGSEENLSNPYINSLRIYQLGNNFGVNQGICDSYYFDKLSVTEVDAKLDYARDDNKIIVRTEYLYSIQNDIARTVVSEYDKEGKLLSAMVGPKVNTGFQTNSMNISLLEYVPESDDSEIYASVLTGVGITPAISKMKIGKRLQGYGFVTESQAVERAKEMIRLSKATYKDAIESDVGFDKENAYYFPTVDTYFDPESSQISNYKTTTLTVNPNRHGALKFDISKETNTSVSHSYVGLYTYSLTTQGAFDIYLLSGNNWDENSIYTDLPSVGNKIDSVNVEYPGVTYYFDVTDTVNTALSKGEDTLSFIIKTSDGNAKFQSLEGTQKSFKPQLILEGLGLDARSKTVSRYDYSNYIDVMKRKKTPADAFEKTPTRILSSVKDYTPVDKMPNLSKYGGWIDGGQYEATGFFYVKEIDGRWWIIDPLGYKLIFMGVTGVSIGTATDITKTAFEKVYGTKENWQLKIHDQLRSYGFNSAGSWSGVENLLTSPESVTPLNVVGFNKSFIHTYDPDKDDNMMNVFDPEFKTACEAYAKKFVKPYADSPYIIGWNTDNEPIANNNMLVAYLNSDPNDQWNIYNYYTAWAWLKDRYGDTAGVEDITDKDKNDWVEFVYDRYMKVCTDAIRKYDKNHMIIGPKMDKHHQGAFRGLQNWCDIVGYDYYGNAWTGDAAQIEQWYKWAGKPLMNQEWYAKGMDACTEESSLTNQAGVGYTVQTQDERGYYYQSFVLSMLESKIFVGWQWFKYMDNDPSNPGQDVSNIDANKGIISREYVFYETLLNHMNDINMNAYGLTQYFDN